MIQNIKKPIHKSPLLKLRIAEKLYNKTRVYKSRLSHIFHKLVWEHLPKNYLSEKENECYLYNLERIGGKKMILFIT